MKDSQKAQRLLYALSDVKDEFIEEAAQLETSDKQRSRGKIVLFPTIIRTAVAVAACLTLVLVGINTLKPNAPSVPERPIALGCNPVEEVSTLSEAESLLGFGLHYDNTEASYIEQSIVIYDGSILEVNLALRDGSGTEYCIRKGKGTEDISGDYTEYAVTENAVLADCDAVLKGNDQGWQLVTWQKNGYSYSISAQEHAMSLDEIQQIVSGID